MLIIASLIEAIRVKLWEHWPGGVVSFAHYRSVEKIQMNASGNEKCDYFALWVLYSLSGGSSSRALWQNAIKSELLKD